MNNSSLTEDHQGSFINDDKKEETNERTRLYCLITS